MRFIVEALDVAPEQIAYASFTGKAAEVLRKKGNPNAMTMHRLLLIVCLALPVVLCISLSPLLALLLL